MLIVVYLQMYMIFANTGHGATQLLISKKCIVYIVLKTCFKPDGCIFENATAEAQPKQP